MPYQFINPLKENGDPKNKKEMNDEMKSLLMIYRRENLIVNDRIFNLQSNVIPNKNKMIEELNIIIINLKKELENKKPWII